MYRGRFRAALRAVPAYGLLDHRAFYLLFALVSCGLLFLGKVDPATTEKAKTTAIDAVVPILDALSRPVATTATVIADIRAHMNVYEDNARLRLTNARLEGWRQTALRYEIENAQLRTLLNVPSRAAASYVSARVVANSGGPFVRSIVANAGYRDGVRKGQVAVATGGLIGRVGEVGKQSSRILLLTDLNSRVPVLAADSGNRAILAGDNTAWPKLVHIPAEHGLKAGEKIITSGHGGVFPPGLTVGEVISLKEDVIAVQTAVDFDRVAFIRIAEYGLTGALSENR